MSIRVWNKFMVVQQLSEPIYIMIMLTNFQTIELIFFLEIFRVEYIPAAKLINWNHAKLE